MWEFIELLEVCGYEIGSYGRGQERSGRTRLVGQRLQLGNSEDSKNLGVTAGEQRGRMREQYLWERVWLGCRRCCWEVIHMSGIYAACRDMVGPSKGGMGDLFRKDGVKIGERRVGGQQGQCNMGVASHMQGIFRVYTIGRSFGYLGGRKGTRWDGDNLALHLVRTVGYTRGGGGLNTMEN